MRYQHPWQKTLAIAAAATLVASPLLTPARARATETETTLQAQAITATPRPGTFCAPSLEPAISTILDRGGLAQGRWGIRVETLDGSKVLYSRNADDFFIPASNIKLFTTAGALQMYHPDSPIRSSNLGAWVRTINQRSHNGYADSLLRSIGGQAAVRSSLAQIGVPADGYRQADGSGLSRRNLVKPSAAVSLLRAMHSASGKDVFFASLPIAGHSGTLSRRMRGTLAQGRVRAKTGTLRGVRALSGYFDHPEYGRLIFSIMANHPGQGQSLVNAIDQIVMRLSQVTPCDQRF